MGTDVKRKYREAMRGKLRLQDTYVDGVSDDEAALEAQQWHDEFTPPYDANQPSYQQDQELPF
jgi:hypothetical protein